MAAPHLSPAPTITDSELVDYLKLEIDHFYQSELYSEQRASWLLTISFGALAVDLNGFIAISERKINAATGPYLILCAICLIGSISCSLLTLWPLGGRLGSLYSPFAKSPSKPVPSQTGCFTQLWIDQYLAHRRRAHIKSKRVIWTLITISLSIGTGDLVLLKNSGAF